MLANHPHQSPYRWVILIIYMYISAVSLLFWVNFAAIETYMETQFHYSSQDVIWLAQVFLVAFFLLTIPAGFIIDKLGYKIGIGIGVVLTGLCPWLKLINPDSYLILLLSQIGIAMGQPFILNGITKIVDNWFTPNQHGTAIGLASLSQTLGMAIGFGITSNLVDHAFDFMLLVYAISASVGAIFYFIFVKNNPAYAGNVQRPASLRQDLLHLFKFRNFNILSLIVMILFSIISGLLTRIQKILHEIHSFNLDDAGNLVAIFLFSGIVGAFFVPLISDKLKNRKWVLSFCLAIGTVSTYFVTVSHDYTINVINGMVLGFFLTATVPLLYTMSIEIVGAAYAGISVGYLQLLGCFGSLLIVPGMQLLWDYTDSAASTLFLAIILLIIALGLSLLLKETYPRNIK